MKKLLLISFALFAVTAVKAQQVPKTVPVSVQSLYFLKQQLDSVATVLANTVLPGNQIQSLIKGMYRATDPVIAEAQRRIIFYQDSVTKAAAVKKPKTQTQ